MTRGDFLCVIMSVIGITLVITHWKGIRKGPPPKIENYALRRVPKSLPSAHWKNKVAGACMNCGHRDFITKHWFQDGLYCENCKSTHKNKIAKHYLYDEAVSCMKCGHKENIPKDHVYSEIKCVKCKRGHYDFYNNNVLNLPKTDDSFRLDIESDGEIRPGCGAKECFGRCKECE